MQLIGIVEEQKASERMTERTIDFKNLIRKYEIQIYFVFEYENSKNLFNVKSTNYAKNQGNKLIHSPRFFCLLESS